jgi:4-hydroxy-3-polyprenylbenzoate decarboxylase
MVMPDEGVFHNIVLVKIKKSYPGQAQKVMNSLWGAGQMMFNKILVVTDADIDMNDSKALARILFERVHPVDDVIFNGGPVDVLDHSSCRFAIGSKLGIDATTKLAGETDFGQAKEPFNENHSVLSELRCNFTLARAGFPVLVIGVDKSNINLRKLHQKLAESGALTGINWVVYIDPEAAGIRIQDMVWLAANNIDPSRDCFYARDINEQVILPMAIDATSKSLAADGFKRQWPNVLVMDDKTIQEVDLLWNKLSLGEFLSSPSLHYKTLVKNEGAVAKG